MNPTRSVAEHLTITIDGRVVRVPRGMTVAAALLNHGATAFVCSPRGQLRGPFCGMGICFECRVTLDGREGVRSCQVLCEDGQRIETHHG